MAQADRLVIPTRIVLERHRRLEENTLLTPRVRQRRLARWCKRSAWIAYRSLELRLEKLGWLKGQDARARQMRLPNPRKVAPEQLAVSGLRVQIEAEDEDWNAVHEALDKILAGERDVVVRRGQHRG